jgi:hypothetical protein
MPSNAPYLKGFVERHIVSEVPPHLADLFDHEEATPTCRLATLALMLASANAVVWTMLHII